MQVVLTLGGTVDASSAGSSSQYMLTDPGRDKKFGTRDDRALRVLSASYNGTGKTVTLIPKGTFSRRPRFRVGMLGTAAVLTS